MLFCVAASGQQQQQQQRVMPVLLDKVLVGRDASCCDLVLDGAARRHCLLFTEPLQPDTLFVEDLSSGDTLVNGKAMSTSTTRLHAGDVVQCGSNYLAVRTSHNPTAVRARDKLARLALECDRIRAKEPPLSDNQTATLQRNERDIAVLKQQIEQLVQHQQQPADGDIGEGAAGGEEDELEVEDDRLLDKTATTSAAPIRKRPQTYKSLTSRVKELDDAMARLERELLAGAAKDEEEEEEEVDELDRFMAENAQVLEGIDVDQKRKELARLKQERDECARLADLARPALMPTAAAAAAPSVGSAFRVIVHEEVEFCRVVRRQRQEEEDAPQPAQQPPSRKRAQVVDEEEAVVDDSFADQVSEWRPPSHQSGDGRTKLNARFGY